MHQAPRPAEHSQCRTDGYLENDCEPIKKANRECREYLVSLQIFPYKLVFAVLVNEGVK